MDRSDQDPLDHDTTLRLRSGRARLIPAAADKPDTLQPGTTLGQYRIIRLLGRGGMGEVYEVEHTTLERTYALKLLPDEFARQPGALERFPREAKVMANLEHPNIVRVDDFGEVGGRYWLRMDLVEGMKAPALVLRTPAWSPLRSERLGSSRWTTMRSVLAGRFRRRCFFRF